MEPSPARPGPPATVDPEGLIVPERAAAVHAAMLGWFAVHGRDLPWRKTRDPWAILVSEVMLQQIQVARAAPFYRAFLARFPAGRRLRIPMVPGVRSLNLGNAVAVAVYEAWRQAGFAGGS